MRYLSLCLLLLLLPLSALGDAVEYKTLQNGIRVLLAPDAHSQFLTLVAYIRQTPPKSPQESVVSELVARSLFFGSQNRSFDSVARSVRQVGGSLDTYYAPEGVAISCFTLPSQQREAIYLLCEALKNADFEAEALDRARKIVVERHKQSEEASPAGVRSALIQSLQCPFEYDPVRYSRVTTEQARDYFRRNYTNDRIVIALSGKFDSKQAARSLDNNLFERESVAVKPDPNPLPKEETTPLQRQGKTPQAYALIGCKAPPVSHPDYPAFAVLNAFLGVGHASRILHHFREEQGIGYEMGTTLQAHLGEPLVAYLQWKAQGANRPSVERVQAQLREQLLEWDRLPMTEKEVARAKSVAINNHLLAQEQIQDRALILAWYEAMGAGYTFAERLPDLIKSVKKEDLERVAKAWLKNPLEAILLPAMVPKN